MILSKDKFFMGIDIGSTSADAVILNDTNKIIYHTVLVTDPDHKVTINKILKDAFEKLSIEFNKKISEDNILFCVGTGYGRSNIFCANKEITEISCHAKGVHYYFPEARTIVDIGGQDSKVISINGNGEVNSFAMNEKCAAGTGRFLEIMSEVLEVDIKDIGQMALDAEKEVSISSMCTVFAESEVISKLAENIAKLLDSMVYGNSCTSGCSGVEWRTKPLPGQRYAKCV